MNEHFEDFFLNCNECILENPRNFYGCFSLGPFQNSQSLTVANALRRTLLSEIRGIAITHLEIDGVAHEYQTLPGVRESALDILLNFKQIVLKKISSFSKPLYGYLNVRGPGIVRASDLKLPPIIQCVDSEQYIATLMENGKLTLKFLIEDFQISLKHKQIIDTGAPIVKLDNFENWKKRNFSSDILSENFRKTTMKNHKGKMFEQIPSTYVFSSDKNIQYNENFSSTKNELFNHDLNSTNGKRNNHIPKTNRLWVDPLFHPILKVNYVIENTEPFQKNQIVMIELWTNGSIHPRKALYDALCYLKTMFEKFDSMKYLNYELANSAFVSEKTNTKFLQSFENNLAFYTFLEKKNSSLFKQKLFFSNEMKKMQQNYLYELNQKQKETFFSLSIDKLRLPSRICESLRRNNIQTIHDLLNRTPEMLKKDFGLGNFAISKIQKNLEQIGLNWDQ